MPATAPPTCCALLAPGCPLPLALWLGLVLGQLALLHQPLLVALQVRLLRVLKETRGGSLRRLRPAATQQAPHRSRPECSPVQL